MQCRCLEHPDAFREIAAEWDGLVLASEDPNPFLLSDFLLTWARHLVRPEQVRVVSAWEDGRLVGGLPLYVRRGGAREGFVRMLGYLGDAAANYTEPLYDRPGRRLWRAMWQALAERRDWDALRLPDVRPSSPILRECEMSADGLGRVELAADHENLAIDLTGGAEAYLRTLSSKLRRDLRAKRRHAVQRYGELVLRPVVGQEAVGEAFELYCAMSRQAFRQRKRRSTFEDERQQVFFREFLTVMERRGWLDAHLLLAGEHPLAVSFGYRLGRGFQWVLTAFDPEARYVRPGYLLIEALVHELDRRGETLYNWYGHDRFYKSQWCNVRTPLYRLTAVRPGLGGARYRLLRTVERALRGVRAARQPVPVPQPRAQPEPEPSVVG